MTLLDAAILGLVEGITEYLPVSSTGHLILTSALLGLDGAGIDAFNIVIQGGAILAVLGLYRVRVLGMVQGLIGQNPEGRRLLVRLLIAFAPAAILGPLLDDTIEATLFQPVPVLAALGIGGVIMLKLGKGRADPSDTDPADLPLRAAQENTHMGARSTTRTSPRRWATRCTPAPYQMEKVPPTTEYEKPCTSRVFRSDDVCRGACPSWTSRTQQAPQT